MTALLALALTFASALTTFFPSSARAAAPRIEVPGMDRAVEPNPYLSLAVAGRRADHQRWREEGQAAMEAWLAAQPEPFAPADLLELVERETGTGANDEPARAERLTRFNTRGGTRSVRITGRLAPTLPTALAATPEDDGDIPHARNLGLRSGQRVRVAGRIGDGPHGSQASGSGDFDFFRIANAGARQPLVVRLLTEPGSAFEPSIVVYDAQGNFLAGNSIFGSINRAELILPRPGDYYVSVGGLPDQSPEDPMDSSTGHGAGSEGAYVLSAELGSARPDTDYYSFDLEAGDILSAFVEGPERDTALAVVLPNGQEAVSTQFSIAFIFPRSSPLPRDGVANLAYVAPVAGRYLVKVSDLPGSFGTPYTLGLRLFRSTYEGTQRRQKVFLDFDGQTVDTSTFGGPGIAKLSPLASFLPAFGLERTDENALIDAVVAQLRLRLAAVRTLSLTASAPQIEIRTSRDHADTFGLEDGVSRVIVGGSILESGIETIGIAESIDVGNFADRESALVLLDILAEFSKTVRLAPDKTRKDMVATALANVIAHEVGHFLGNFHTSNASAHANLMDQGGLIEEFFQLGGDGVFGTADDGQLRFGVDAYAVPEGMTGSEDTLNTIGLALATQPASLPRSTRIERLAPAPLLAGLGGAEVLVTGDVFTPLSSAMVEGGAVRPRFEHRGLLGIPVDAQRLRQPGALELTVVTPGAGASAPRELDVAASLQLLRAAFERDASGHAVAGALGANTWVRTSKRGNERGHSGPSSFYFGNPAADSYLSNVRESATLTSPPVRLPKSALLNFAYLLETERNAPFDRAEVQISRDGFATFQRLLSNHGEGLRDATGRFEQALVDLSAFAGQTVQVRFVFDTVDEVNNLFEGWYVDDVVILAPEAKK